MDTATAASGAPLAAFIPFLLLGITIAIINVVLAKKKGKNQIKYFILSILPMVGFFLTIYLLSFLDKGVEEKINKIYEKIHTE